MEDEVEHVERWKGGVEEHLQRRPGRIKMATKEEETIEDFEVKKWGILMEDNCELETGLRIMYWLFLAFVGPT